MALLCILLVTRKVENFFFVFSSSILLLHEQHLSYTHMWPPWWLSGKDSACNVGDLGSTPGQEDPVHWRRKWQPTPVFFPGKSCGQKEPGRLQSTGLQEMDMI